MARHRVAIIAGTALVVIGGLPLLFWLRFDFNPINLRDPHTESVATYLELARDPDNGVYAIQAIAPTLEQADKVAAEVEKIPEVAQARTLSWFIPTQQEQKLPLIAKAAAVLLPALEPKTPSAAPTDQETVEALKEAADRLIEAADAPQNASQKTGVAAARRLAAALQALAGARARKARCGAGGDGRSAGLRLRQSAQGVARAGGDAGEPARHSRARLDRARTAGRASRSRPRTIPAIPTSCACSRGAVLKVEPNAILGPVSVLEAGDTIVGAFLEAGALALASIAVILLLVLRKPRDVR